MISGAALQRFIDRARQRFDIILLDSGPVPGSIEASIASAHADAVVLVVARGDTRPYVDRSIAYLRELPVSFAGLVFNRARKTEIERYGSSRVSGSGSVSPQRMVPTELPENLRFGPIPRCVASRSIRPGEQFGSN
jgi:Mrp family chromosome partitioning ATPase